MTDKQAHSKLKDIETQRNTIGVGGYRNSKRDRDARHKIFSKATREAEALSDRLKLKGASIGTTINEKT